MRFQYASLFFRKCRRVSMQSKKSDRIRRKPYAMPTFPGVCETWNITLRKGMTSVWQVPTFWQNLYLHLESSLKKDTGPPETLACASIYQNRRRHFLETRNRDPLTRFSTPVHFVLFLFPSFVHFICNVLNYFSPVLLSIIHSFLFLFVTNE